MYAVVALAAVAGAAFFVYCKIKLSYWKRRNVPDLGPRTPAGDIWLSLIGYKNVYVVLQDAYNEFKKRGQKFGGLYFTFGHIFFPVDYELIKRILQTDFDYFHDRGMYVNKEEQPLSAHLVSLNGQTWKSLRSKLRPMFSLAKLKNMVPQLNKHGDELVRAFKCDTRDVVVYDMVRRYASLVISTCFFGVEANDIWKENSGFLKAADKISRCSVTELMKLFVKEGVSNPGNIIKVIFSDPFLIDFFTTIVADAIKYRKEANVPRNNFIDSLLTIMENDQKSETDPLFSFDANDVAAQVMVFFTGGFETSTSAVTFALYRLAKNIPIQEKLRQELLTELERNNQQFDYNVLSNLKYLDSVVTG